MRRLIPLCSFVLALSPVLVDAGAGEVKQFTIANGRVTLVTDAVPVRTILQEWARLGQSKIVNAEKVQGPPLTLQLVDVPEDQALDIVLRSASGYLAAPRAEMVANASRFDRIVILATSRPTTAAAAPPPMPQQQAPQMYPAQPPMMQHPAGDDQDESDEPRPVDEAPQPQPPGVAPRPGPIQVTPNPNPNAPQGEQPQLPVTSPRPGLIQPPQQQPPPQPPPNRPIP